MLTRPRQDEVPDSPGVYLFRDRNDRPIYVGKAKSLRSRLSSYFGSGLGTRTEAMVAAAERVEWIVTGNETEALMLEFSLIQEHRPRFNIRLRDDKSFPYLALTRDQQWPRAAVMRGRRRKGVQYFGPYAHAYAIRETLELLLRTFPIRSCSDSKFNRHAAIGRPCLLYHIERCAGPCIGAVTAPAYAEMVDGLAAVLGGESEATQARIQAEMSEASEGLEFERAARLRDRLTSLEKAVARQEMVSTRNESFDVIAGNGDELEAVIAVLMVRRGRVTGRLISVFDRVEELAPAELMERVIGELYAEAVPPPILLVKELPSAPTALAAWLAQRRGGPVTVKRPQRGSKRRLIATAEANAKEEDYRRRLRRRRDHNSRAQALRSLQAALNLTDPPLRIECYDISTVQGTATVGSMVVMEDGLPRPSEYRHFRVRSVIGQDDFAALEEVLQRRFSRYLEERKLPAERRRPGFAYPPSLVLLDGGEGQVAAGMRVMSRLRLSIPVAGIAKRLEEVYLPDRKQPISIGRGEEALFLLQAIRDEAHRFALAYHTKLRGKRMLDSLLEGVPGLGPVRRRNLLRRFGSLKRLRQAQLSELEAVLPDAVASSLYAILHAPSPNSSNDATAQLR